MGENEQKWSYHMLDTGLVKEELQIGCFIFILNSNLFWGSDFCFQEWAIIKGHTFAESLWYQKASAGNSHSIHSYRSHGWIHCCYLA